MKKLILVRHASTRPLETGNIEVRDYNELLSEEGHRQAEALAERLADVSVYAVYSSPQPRALATAFALNRGVTVNPNLEDWRGAETAGQMYKRVIGFTSILKGVIVIVSHGSPLAMILCHCTGSPPELQASWGITPASISIVHNGVVVAVNDISHLGTSPERMEYDPHTWTYLDELRME